MLSFEQQSELARPACASLLEDQQGVRHLHPWTQLYALLLAARSELPLVGYGSLMNPESARRTIPSTPAAGHPPVLAFGAYRVFNYALQHGDLTHYPSAGPLERAVLNTEWTGRGDAVLTGRLLTVPLSDFAALAKRERAYDLVPVACVPWGEPDAPPTLAYALQAADRPVDGVRYVDNGLLPVRSYLELCREGTRLVDAEFERAFLQTTWLGNGTTRLDSYLATNDQQ